MLRKSIPTRSGNQIAGNYRQHKNQLRGDFNQSCGYCDGLDQYSGGWRGFQIDHFAPHSKFPQLKETYANLVYSCAFCNRSKSNKWIGNDPNVPNNGTEGFIDPCDAAYENHLSRSDEGQIIPLTALGSFIHRQLHLGLLRHQLLWQAEALADLKIKVQALIPVVKESGDKDALIELLERFVQITNDYERLRSEVVEA